MFKASPPTFVGGFSVGQTKRIVDGVHCGASPVHNRVGIPKAILQVSGVLA